MQELAKASRAGPPGLLQEADELSVTRKIRVMIVDGHPVVREGLRELLGRVEDLEVVAEAGDGVEAVEVAAGAQPDVVIMEVIMPVKSGIDACREIRDKSPDCHVLMLTASTDDDAVLQAVAAGATGYLQKSSTGRKLIATLRDVAEGEFRVPAEAMRRMAASVPTKASKAESDQAASLTAREREVLELFCQGMTYAEIAEVVGYRPLSIRNTIYGIQNKLKVKSKPEMVVRAVRSGLLDTSPIQ